MSKKTTTARRRVQHNKPKAQKSFDLVHPENTVTESEKSRSIETEENTPTEAEESSTTEAKASTAINKQEKPRAAGSATATQQAEPQTQERQSTPAPSSASARLAARRQAALRLQQRSATTLITSEHFAYVRKDLIRIAVFAAVMFTAIIVLYFIFGRAS